MKDSNGLIYLKVNFKYICKINILVISKVIFYYHNYIILNEKILISEYYKLKMIFYFIFLEYSLKMFLFFINSDVARDVLV